MGEVEPVGGRHRFPGQHDLERISVRAGREPGGRRVRTPQRRDRLALVLGHRRERRLGEGLDDGSGRDLPLADEQAGEMAAIGHLAGPPGAAGGLVGDVHVAVAVGGARDGDRAELMAPADRRQRDRIGERDPELDVIARRHRCGIGREPRRTALDRAGDDEPVATVRDPDAAAAPAGTVRHEIECRRAVAPLIDPSVVAPAPRQRERRGLRALGGGGRDGRDERHGDRDQNAKEAHCSTLRTDSCRKRRL
ncbi:MAG: hypothetical protein FJX67_03315 [Alphaproteobacteria bacterium]|nr:hypothetical protein [Alphaproteobacteria bacterium]